MEFLSVKFLFAYFRTHSLPWFCLPPFWPLLNALIAVIKIVIVIVYNLLFLLHFVSPLKCAVLRVLHCDHTKLWYFLRGLGQRADQRRLSLFTETGAWTKTREQKLSFFNCERSDVCATTRHTDAHFDANVWVFFVFFFSAHAFYL